MAGQLRDGGKDYRNPYGLAPSTRSTTVPGPVVSVAPDVQTVPAPAPDAGRGVVLLLLAAVAIYFLVRGD